MQEEERSPTRLAEVVGAASSGTGDSLPLHNTPDEIDRALALLFDPVDQIGP